MINRAEMLEWIDVLGDDDCTCTLEQNTGDDPTTCLSCQASTSFNRIMEFIESEYNVLNNL